MAKKKLEEMNNGELYKHYKRNSRIAKACKWAFVIVPFIALFGVKFNEYIAVVDEPEVIKLSFGAVLALIVGAIAMINEFKKEDKTKPVASVVRWGLAFLFAILFETMLADLTLILGVEFAGQMVACGFDYWDKSCIEEYTDYKKLAREDHTLLVKTEKKKVEEKKEENVGANLV